MNKVAIAFLTKDRVELSKRTIVPLLSSSKDATDKFDLWWIDGSDTEAGRQLPEKLACTIPVRDTVPGKGFTGPRLTSSVLKVGSAAKIHTNIKGGADTAVVYALTEMLKGDYTHVGLVENDVLLHKDWFGPTMVLFERGRAEGLEAGAVSTRCYVDRILCQRQGFALMHGLGWGTQILTRQAAELTLKHFRTHWTSENRRVFARLSGIDIGSYWAFRTNEHFTTPDWGNDAVLASHGLASLALTPSPVEMIGQTPSLADQGLKLATEPVEDRRNDDAFDRFAYATRAIREGYVDLGVTPVRYRDDAGVEYIFAHQLSGLSDAFWDGDWRLKWFPGFGGFAARGFGSWHDGTSSNGGATFECYVSGTCRFMVMGGEKGGQVEIQDLKSNYTVRPTLLPEASNQVTQVVAPASVSWRKLRLTVLSGSCCFYGLQCQESQPTVREYSFDHSKLWAV